MNEDYLWNKTGEDAGIQELERSLSVFRYEHAEPPIPVIKADAIGRSAWRLWPRLALAGSTAVMAVGAIWFLLPAGPETAKVVVEKKEAPFADKKEELATEFSLPATPQVDPVAERPRPAVKPIRVRHSKPTRIAKQSAKNERAPVLTSEEKYAYRQLMLALSITGSKLKIVKDTINGSEEIGSSDKR